ncbi:MAG: 50S ribosomal protein L22 [Patescibacteria group bacterium]
MEIKASLNYLRIAPRKVRSVIDLIRGKEIKEAEAQLKFLSRRASAPVYRLLKSAIANAKSNFNVDKENLFIKEIKVDEGVPFKRQRAMSRGRAFPIMKRTSHIIISLGVKEGVKIEKKQSVIRETKINTETKTSSKSINKKPVKETTIKPKKQNWAKRIFRRKSI